MANTQTPRMRIGNAPLDRDRLHVLMEPLRATVTTYLPARNDLPSRGVPLHIHWANLRRSLAADGAREADLASIDATADDAQPAGDTNVAIAADGELLAVGFITEGIVEPFGSAELIPSILPIVAWEQSRIPHIVVVADRVGADILAISPEYQDSATTVAGDDEYIHRGAPGGWSQRRFQQRAENLWEQNAKGVAAEVERLAATINARAIVVAGDGRAVGFLRKHLSKHNAQLVRNIDGARADWSLDRIAEDAVTQVATVAAEELRGHLQTFSETRGTPNNVEGAEDVFQALRRARVGTLYVVDDTFGDRPRGWTATDPAHIYPDTDPPDLVVPLYQAPLTDIAVRSAVLTGADVIVVPNGANAPSEGLGATLRHH